jgi:hypothetical protein
MNIFDTRCSQHTTSSKLIGWFSFVYGCHQKEKAPTNWKHTRPDSSPFSSWKPANEANLDLWDICNCIWFTLHCHHQMSISCTQKVQQVKQINHAGDSTPSIVRNTVCSLSPWPCRSAWSRAAWLQQKRSNNGLLHIYKPFLQHLFTVHTKVSHGVASCTTNP